MPPLRAAAHDGLVRAMRRDAQVRREALIQAAARCFLRSGYLVPLDEIAAEAGVGRGTLYRNFSDRMALAIAIFEHELDRMEAALDPSASLGDTIRQLVFEGANASTLFARLAADLPFSGDNRRAFEALRERLTRLLEPVADKARHEGMLSPELGAEHLLLATRMISGVLRPYLSREEIEAQVAEAVPLLLTGLRPRDAG
jgi:AcrR family transcriptional regulator